MYIYRYNVCILAPYYIHVYVRDGHCTLCAQILRSTSADVKLH